MRSPKFPLKQKDLEVVINLPRLKSVWKNKVRDAMRKQLIPDPIEHLDFHTQLNAQCNAIYAEVSSGDYIPRPATRLLSEKSKGLCRQLVLPTVKDALILQTLSDALWFELSKKAPSQNAFYAPQDHRFSKIVKGHSSEYGAVRPWLEFQKQIFGFPKKYNFIIVTDIANFYDFISYDHLRNILADLSIAREHALDLLIYTLSHMLWQPDYMPRVQVGLPQMNLDAPRMLAHCFLFEIDNLLVKNKQIDFARFMDDIDIGTNTISEAKLVLRDLDLSLQTRQVRLNSGKTKILSEKEAIKHFKIRENRFFDAFDERIIKKISSGAPLTREQRFITFAISWGLRTDCFSTGNGEKILKRCINYSLRLRSDIAANDLSTILRGWPGTRENVLRWIVHSKSPDAHLEVIVDFMSGGDIIDHFTPLQIVQALVSARLNNTDATNGALGRTYELLDHREPWGLYSKLWLFSKYQSAKAIMELIESTVSMWITQEQLSGLVAGMFPRFIQTDYLKKSENIIARVGSRWAQDVLLFHQRLYNSTEGFTSVRPFVQARNNSQPNRLTHAKFLMLLTLLHNRTIAPNAVAQLRAQHQFALTDKFYATIVPPT